MGITDQHPTIAGLLSYKPIEALNETLVDVALLPSDLPDEEAIAERAEPVYGQHPVEQSDCVEHEPQTEVADTRQVAGEQQQAESSSQAFELPDELEQVSNTEEAEVVEDTEEAQVQHSDESAEWPFSSAIGGSTDDTGGEGLVTVSEFSKVDLIPSEPESSAIDHQHAVVADCNVVESEIGQEDASDAVASVVQVSSKSTRTGVPALAKTDPSPAVIPTAKAKPRSENIVSAETAFKIQPTPEIGVAIEEVEEVVTAPTGWRAKAAAMLAKALGKEQKKPAKKRVAAKRAPKSASDKADELASKPKAKRKPRAKPQPKVKKGLFGRVLARIGFGEEESVATPKPKPRSKASTAGEGRTAPRKPGAAAKKRASAKKAAAQKGVFGRVLSRFGWGEKPAAKKPKASKPRDPNAEPKPRKPRASTVDGAVRPKRKVKPRKKAQPKSALQRAVDSVVGGWKSFRGKK